MTEQESLIAARKIWETWGYFEGAIKTIAKILRDMAAQQKYITKLEDALCQAKNITKDDAGEWRKNI